MALLRWREPVSLWSPLRELADIQDTMHRLLVDDARVRAGQRDRSEWALIPPADLVESQREVVLTLDVPGMRLEDFDIGISGEILTVKGERRDERERQDGDVHRLERAYGAFQRSFLLPGAVDADRVKATYKDGVLEVRLPRTPETQPKKIAVHTS